MHTGATPLGFIHLFFKMLGQAGHLKRCVVSGLGNARVPEATLYVLGNLLACCQVDNVDVAVAKRIGKQHHFEVVRLDVLMHAALFQVDIAVRLKVNP